MEISLNHRLSHNYLEILFVTTKAVYFDI